jgi:leucyl-tRNA synthetase
MTTKYIPQEFEKKWIEKWKKDRLSTFDFTMSNLKKPSFAKASEGKEKFYTLVELPYTSGDLHIGHWFTFVAPDVLSRFKRMNGYDVFYPMGYDAFGLPAENAAIERKIHPKDWTMKNVENMTRQFHTMGTMINNWDDLVVTCLPKYYRWNQWIFLKMFEKGLAYRGKTLSNWCEFDQTVLANENIEDGKCWRCGRRVVQKEVEQWFLRITKYADRLEWPDYAPPSPKWLRRPSKASSGKPEKPKVDWPISVRVGQNNWIGKKEGINMDYPVKNSDEIITCFTTAPVNFAMTFIVLAPDHKLVNKILNGNIKVDSDKKEEIKKYVKKALAKTEQQRLVDVKEKTGVFTGLYATNRIAGWDVPIWVSDFVVGEVGTGAVQGCPGHDYKDFEFAKKFGLPIIRVVIGPDGDKSKIDSPEQIIIKGMKGKMVNSKFLNGLDFSEGLQTTMDYAEKKGWGKRVVTYHLRDWSVSRQRYWGTPVPMIHCKDCGIVPVPEKDLPVELPYEVDFTPKGKPPLATNEKWIEVNCPKCDKPAKRDPETLDTFFDSAWYWFRYVSPHYNKAPFEKKEVGKLTPVDVYFGGAEHTLGHTLYARFFTKFFNDIGLVDQEEFALKRVQHGIVLGPDGNKMSKSKGNVVNPDDAVDEYGADTVRMYLCFMMPYEGTGPWSDETIAGVNRFLIRVWKIFQSYSRHPELVSGSEIPNQVRNDKNSEDKRLVSKLQKTIQKVTLDIERIKMNTAIAAMMEFLNAWEGSTKHETQSTKHETLNMKHAKKFLQILAPFAPFMTEEIWRNVFGEKESIHLSSWPRVDEKSLVEEEIKIPVQVNGKVRTVIAAQANDIREDTVVNKAAGNEKVKKYLEGKKYKAIYVKGKILNFVLTTF